jgi:hypothetical protein
MGILAQGLGRIPGMLPRKGGKVTLEQSPDARCQTVRAALKILDGCCALAEICLEALLTILRVYVISHLERF